jgi:hypothetical protein
MTAVPAANAVRARQTRVAGTVVLAAGQVVVFRAGWSATPPRQRPAGAATDASAVGRVVRAPRRPGPIDT